MSTAGVLQAFATVGALTASAISLWLTYRARSHPLRNELYKVQLSAADDVSEMTSHTMFLVFAALQFDVRGTEHLRRNTAAYRGIFRLRRALIQYAVVLPDPMLVQLKRLILELTALLEQRGPAPVAEERVVMAANAYAGLVAAVRKELGIEPLTGEMRVAFEQTFSLRIETKP